jgi:4-cresol dehydrogenase (hydroxylating)
MSQLNDFQAVSVEAVLAAMAAVVGAAHVLADQATRERHARSTAARPVLPLALVRPANAREVSEVVKVAAQARLAVYPISTGKNWGYGDACAVGAGQVVLDLSRMNRIVHVDPELAYAVIEPGVTQHQLSSYLRERGYPLWADCTGAGPDTSYIGNIMERGFGHSPYGNRLQHVAGMEVVLASGELLQTGFGHYRQARAAHLFPYGVGPFLDGLFTQSNMGIVTRLGIWLMPEAECVNHFLCSVPEHADIGPVVDALRPLRLDGTLRSILHIGNDMRVFSSAGAFPRAAVPQGARLPDDLRAQMRRDSGVGAWTVSGALYGSHAQVAAARSALRKALRPTRGRAAFVSEGSLRTGAVAARLLGNTGAGQRLRAKLAVGRSLFAMNRGVPDGRFLAGAYWRRRGGVPANFPANANPAQDNCGLLWVSPVLPLRGADMLAAHDLARASFDKHGFDLFATFSMINERALGGVLTVAYDKEDPDEAARARACHDEVFERMFDAGYIPYRVGNQAMGRLDPQADSYWRTVGAIKAALDPAGILAPGRYQPDVAAGLM